MPPQAQIKTDFFHRLAAAISRYPHDELLIRQVKRDALAIRGADPVVSAEVLGAIASIQGDADETRKQFHLALSRADADEDTFTNYLVSLCLLRDNTEFVRVLEDRGPRWFKLSATAVAGAANLLLEAGLPVRALELYKRYPQFADLVNSKIHIERWGEAVVHTIAAFGHTESSFEAAIAVARKVLADQGVSRSANSIHIVPDSSVGKPSVVYRMGVHTTIEGAGRLEELVFDALAEADLEAIDSGAVTILVSCLEPREVNNASIA